ncbi:hypothetical protein CBR_g70713 [Chara braunii]|uniref:DUF1421 domain-containing protein n=1 Tax=Chara braunii TaxID=69332 RepID=A0A388K9V0_CHABU|nr:hypothetical protein CBR_g70713 [Chara braunii]|eukprot:GBG66835.1 hypothetical protein CBR_g70713 [Chara braunii]
MDQGKLGSNQPSAGVRVPSVLTSNQNEPFYELLQASTGGGGGAHSSGLGSLSPSAQTSGPGGAGYHHNHHNNPSGIPVGTTPLVGEVAPGDLLSHLDISSVDINPAAIKAPVSEGPRGGRGDDFKHGGRVVSSTAAASNGPQSFPPSDSERRDGGMGGGAHTGGMTGRQGSRDAPPSDDASYPNVWGHSPSTSGWRESNIAPSRNRGPAHENFGDVPHWREPEMQLRGRGPTRDSDELERDERSTMMEKAAGVALSASVAAAVERAIKRLVDRQVDVLEELKQRVEKVESAVERLEGMTFDLQRMGGDNHGEQDGRLRALEHLVREVLHSVQVLRDKHEIAEAHAELSKLQLSKMNTSKADEGSPTVPTSLVPPQNVEVPGNAELTPSVSNYQQQSMVSSQQPIMAMAPKQDQMQQQQQLHPPPPVPSTPVPAPHPHTLQLHGHQGPSPPPMAPPQQQLALPAPASHSAMVQPSLTSAPQHAVPPPPASHPSAYGSQPDGQQHYLPPQQQQNQGPQMPPPPPQQHPAHSAPPYQPQARPELSPQYGVPPPAGPYSAPLEPLPCNPLPAYSAHSQGFSTAPDAMPPYMPSGYGPSQRGQQHHPSYDGPAPGRSQGGSPVMRVPLPPPSSGQYALPHAAPVPYEANAPSSYPGGPQFRVAQPVPSAPVGATVPYPRLQTAQPVSHQSANSGSAVSGGSSGGGGERASLTTSRVPIDKVINDVAHMGFNKEDVRSVVKRLTENGQSVDLNVVLDKLMSEGIGSSANAPKPGWFGR